MLHLFLLKYNYHHIDEMVEVRLEGHAAELAALAAFLGLAGQLAVQRVQLASQLSV